MNKVERMFEKLAESIQTINHNSGRTADAMEKIAEGMDRMEICISRGFAKSAAEHQDLLRQIALLWKIFFICFVILGGLVGIKIALP